MRRISNLFLAGLIASIPLGATVFFLRFVFSLVDGMLRTPARTIVGRDIPGIGAVAGVLLVLLLGFLATNILGRRLISAGESLISRVPLAGSVYATVKQIVEAFGNPGRTAFKHVCLIEWPRRDIHCLAFVTGELPPTVRPGGSGRYMSVFVPTSPNPTGGFLMVVPEHDIVYLDIPVEDGLKMVISGGILSPGEKHTGGTVVGGD